MYIQELARELGRKGHLVDIFTRAHQSEHESLINLGQNARLIHLEAGEGEIPKIAVYCQLQKFICSLENFRKQSSLHYDLIHSHYWLSGLAGGQLRVWWHVPHIVMFHTLGAVKNRIGIGENEPELRIESEREVVADCERIVAATMGEREELIHHYDASARKISIIPCGVNLDLFKPLEKEIALKELGLDHQKVILFVGRMDPLKGLSQLFMALTQLTGDDVPRLIVVGGDDHSRAEIQALRGLAKKLRIQKQVSFIGAVAQERLPLFYSAADICIIPSYYESFGMVALESLACGTPVVAADVGGMRCIIRHGEMGYIARSNSPRHLSSKIAQLLSQRGGSVERRRAMIAEFSWANIADLLLREYNGVLRQYSHRVNPRP